MTCRGIDGLRVARGGSVAAAVVRRAQMRAAFENLARNFNVWLTRVEAAAFGATPWVFRDTAGFRCVSLVLRRIPVVSPFPDIADHVVETVAVRRKCFHRRGTLETARAALLMRKLTLPCICHLVIVGHELITPRVVGSLKS